MGIFFRNAAKNAARKAEKLAAKAEKLAAKDAAKEAKLAAKRARKSGGLEPLIAEPPMPYFEEVFEVERAIFNSDPLKQSSNSQLVEGAEHSADFIAEHDIKVFIVTLMVGLQEFLTRMVEVPTHHHKGMREVGRYLEDGATVPVAYTQWNQSHIQGLAAKMILKGRSRTVLFGPALAMVRNIAPYGKEFDELIESAHEAGNIVYLLAVDGLAYAVFEVSHRIQEVPTV